MPTNDDDVMFDQLVDHIEEWYGRIDREFDRLLTKRTAATGEKISCFSCPNAEPGCCYQKTVISFFEAFPIVRYIMRSGMDTPEFRAKLRELGDAMEAGEREEWLKEKHPCVFLEKGRCSIYPVRPLVCRTYFVINPPEMCQPENDTEQIAFIDNREALGAGFQKGKLIHKALHLKENEMRILMGTMPRMVLLGLEVMTHDNYPELVRSQIWPTADGIDSGWVDGNNPFREKLYQIRRSKEASNG